MLSRQPHPLLATLFPPRKFCEFARTPESRSNCGYKGVSLSFLLVVAHKLLNSFYDAVFLARSRVGSRGAPVARLGAKRTYPICPILRRRYLASLSLSRNVRGRILYACGKGWAQAHVLIKPQNRERLA